MPAAPQAKAKQTRREILAHALDLASVEGLGGLTIGRLATATNLSKSGLFAHFGSKEDLQLAVVEAAREVFVRKVLDGHEDGTAGLSRLLHLSLAWTNYVAEGAFRGGCFFAAASSEVDDRPGRVRDLVVRLTGQWLAQLEFHAEEAIDQGQFVPDCDAALVAFEIHAFVQEANWAFQLHGRSEAFDLARRAIGRAIRSVATASGRVLLGAERFLA